MGVVAVSMRVGKTLLTRGPRGRGSISHDLQGGLPSAKTLRLSLLPLFTEELGARALKQGEASTERKAVFGPRCTRAGG